ncbi:MAG TPA: cytidylate kinase family protein [Candidatus Nanoarchaeia archaeon]|nr:cytidylate kinase family protein [Candidatus Nanoarchaeia archaeon]
MIITVSGKAGSGKSTIAKILAKKLKLRHYSIGDLMREMAKEKKITLLELNKIAEKDESIDFELDEKLKELGKKSDNFIVDGRLTAFFIPNADLRIFLDADDKTRATRILKNKRKDEKNLNLADTMKNIQKREESEKIRYLRYYGADYTDKKLYNKIIDTSKLAPEQIVRLICDAKKIL